MNMASWLKTKPFSLSGVGNCSMIKMWSPYRSILGIWIFERQSSRLSFWKGYFCPSMFMSADVGLCMFIHSSPLFLMLSNCFSTSDIGFFYPLLCFGPEVAVINWYVTPIGIEKAIQEGKEQCKYSRFWSWFCFGKMKREKIKSLPSLRWQLLLTCTVAAATTTTAATSCIGSTGCYCCCIDHKGVVN